MGITLHQIWDWRKLITVEPLIFCYFMPPLLLYVANENFALEKSCRVNLKLDTLVCDAMMSKTKFNVVCASDEDDTNNSTNTSPSLSTFNYTVNGTEIDFVTFQDNVCNAETDSQALVTSYNSIRAILSSFFSLIIIVFAGGWSDKKKLRRPLMLFAMVGEFIGGLTSLLSAILFDEIPMQFARILGTVVPAIFGGTTMLLMGCYAYLTCITTEENRTSRFGVFAIYITVLATIGSSFSGELLNGLGYVYIYILAIIFYALGILQIVFFLKEPSEPLEEQKVEPQTDKSGLDNPAFENIELQNGQTTTTNDGSPQQTVTVEPEVVSLKQKVKTFLTEFFDPTLVMDSLKVLSENHKNFGRAILYLCLFNAVLFSCAVGDADYINYVARIKFGWEGPELGRFFSFATFSALVGTAIMTNIMTKFFKISDGMIGIVGSIGSIISKFVFGIANKEVLFWIAQGLDLFVSTKALANRSILSKTFDENNLGKVFSLLAIMDVLVGFVAPTLYAEIYQATLNTNPSTIFHFSQLFLVPSIVLFGITHYIFEHKRKGPDDMDGAAPSPDVTTTKC